MTKKWVAWVTLSRLPFHSVGVLPFVLGAVLAWQEVGVFRWGVFSWGVAGVVLVMLATYYAGEYWDHAEDRISTEMGGSRFAGGSGVVTRGDLPRRAAFWASLVSVILALGVGFVLWLGYGTGPWTLPLGLLGLLGGFFYSTRPVRWVGTGVGELWIAFCYGWLPVAVGVYLQLGRLIPQVHWMAIPVGLTIFNVILLNEYPDYEADRATEKRNILVRLGRERGAWLYTGAHVMAGIAMGLSLLNGVPLATLWVYVPVWLVALALSVLMLRGAWRDRNTLEVLCGVNILVNLGTTVAYIVGQVL